MEDEKVPVVSIGGVYSVKASCQKKAKPGGCLAFEIYPGGMLASSCKGFFYRVSELQIRDADLADSQAVGVAFVGKQTEKILAG